MTMTGENAYGWYGKVPGLGDFIRSNLSPSFVQAFDRWMQALLLEGRETLGERWRESYLQAPIWRFALSPGVCGQSGAVGIVMPSVDRVGRQFPLCLAAETEAPAWPAFLAAEPAYAPLEAAALAMLEDGAALPTLSDALASIPPLPASPALHPAPAGTGGTLKTSRPVAEALVGIAENERSSIWVAVVGGENRLLLTDGLPEGMADVQAFFDLNAPCWASPHQQSEGA